MQTSRWPISKLPIAHLEPFPYHKGELYVELLDRLAKYVTDQLHPNLRETVEHMVEELEQILALQHGKYVEGIQDFQRIHDAFMTDVNSALMALNDNAVTDLADDPGSVFGQKLRELFIRDLPEMVMSGDWTFTRGRTNNSNRSIVAVERDFDGDRGDLFTSRTQLRLSVLSQEGTSQNPPGYSSAEIALVDPSDSEIAEPYQGVPTRMLIISNRFLFNKRVEVNMGGTGRAVLRSGVDEGQEIAELGLHNTTYPRFAVYGSSNTSHGGNRRDLSVADRSGFMIYRAPRVPDFEIINRDSEDIEQKFQVSHFQAGHTSIRNYRNSELTGQIRFEDTDDSLRLSAPGGVRLGESDQSRTDVQGFFHIDHRRLTLYSENGTAFRIQVSNTGQLSAVGV